MKLTLAHEDQAPSPSLPPTLLPKPVPESLLEVPALTCLQPQGEGALCRQLYQTQPDDGIWQNKINPVGELLRGTRGQSGG